MGVGAAAAPASCTAPSGTFGPRSLPLLPSCSGALPAPAAVCGEAEATAAARPMPSAVAPAPSRKPALMSPPGGCRCCWAAARVASRRSAATTESTATSGILLLPPLSLPPPLAPAPPPECPRPPPPLLLPPLPPPLLPPPPLLLVVIALQASLPELCTCGLAPLGVLLRCHPVQGPAVASGLRAGFGGRGGKSPSVASLAFRNGQEDASALWASEGHRCNLAGGTSPGRPLRPLRNAELRRRCPPCPRRPHLLAPFGATRPVGQPSPRCARPRSCPAIVQKVARSPGRARSSSGGACAARSCGVSA